MFRSMSLLLVLAASLSLAACSSEEDNGTGSTCPTGSTLTYDTFGQQFMMTYCTGCHNSAKTGDDRHKAPVDINLDTIDGIHAHLDGIDSEAAGGPERVNVSMPPGKKKPSEEDRKKLGEWLACEKKTGA
jgi:uncharacterized membrane protein